jgi:hypothetical protein
MEECEEWKMQLGGMEATGVEERRSERGRGGGEAVFMDTGVEGSSVAAGQIGERRWREPCLLSLAGKQHVSSLGMAPIIHLLGGRFFRPRLSACEDASIWHSLA